MYLLGLFALICVSGFFSSSETGMMALNRYKLMHLVRAQHRTAKLVAKMLARPDRLLGVILIGNTFANNLVSILAILLAKQFFGDDVAMAVSVVSIVLTLMILIFAEVGPKTLAAIYPQRVAFIVAWPLFFLLKLLYPLVWLANTIVNGSLRLFGVRVNAHQEPTLSRDELRTVLNEAGDMISSDHQDMLLRILDLEQAVVEDIMVPRVDVIGINLNDEWHIICEQLKSSQYGYLPLYRGDIEQLEGMLYIKNAVNLMLTGEWSMAGLLACADDVYYIPEGTSLTTQLLNFRSNKRRIGVVVDEYGEILGLATLEDILEEIVGEFTTNFVAMVNGIHPQSDGSALVDGGIHLRELNRAMKTTFPTRGPKTLNGLIVEYLEFLPPSGSSLLINGYPIEVLQVKDNTVKTARIMPCLR